MQIALALYPGFTALTPAKTTGASSELGRSSSGVKQSVRRR
jgi:hypothetical protein